MQVLEITHAEYDVTVVYSASEPDGNWIEDGNNWIPIFGSAKLHNKRKTVAGYIFLSCTDPSMRSLEMFDVL